MPKSATIEIHDVTVDGFPTEGPVAFAWGGEVFTGWPLIDHDNSYPSDKAFASPEQAKAGPLNIAWEASEDRVTGRFSGVRYWFRLPDLQN